jgi:hypothetical protein
MTIQTILSRATHPGLRIIEPFGSTGKQLIFSDDLGGQYGHIYNFSDSLPAHIIYVSGDMGNLLTVDDGFYNREIVENSVILTPSTEEEYKLENPANQTDNRNE